MFFCLQSAGLLLLADIPMLGLPHQATGRQTSLCYGYHTRLQKTWEQGILSQIADGNQLYKRNSREILLWECEVQTLL